jgi:hypothetical protein
MLERLQRRASRQQQLPSPTSPSRCAAAAEGARKRVRGADVPPQRLTLAITTTSVLLPAQPLTQEPAPAHASPAAQPAAQPAAPPTAPPARTSSSPLQFFKRQAAALKGMYAHVRVCSP